jgi:hypothetical protein
MVSYRVCMQGDRFVVEVTYASGRTAVAGVFDTRGVVEAWIADQLVEAERRALQRPKAG